MMPEMDGVTFLRAAFEIDPTLAGVVMTGHGTLHTAVQAMQAGALDYILKPFRLGAVLPVLTRSLAVRRLRMENIELHQAVAMYEMSKAIGLAVDFDTVLRKVADAAMAQSRIRAVAVLLPAGDGGEFEVAAARGENRESVEGMRIPFTYEGDAPAGLPGSVSIPMMSGGNLTGILSFRFEQPQRPIAPGQIKALHILAGTAASALEAASLLEKVRTADKQYRRLAENAADLIFRYDLRPARRLAYVNRAVAPIIGYAPEEFHADPDLILKVVHPEDRALAQTMLNEGYLNGTALDLRFVHRDGSIVKIEQRAVQVRDQDGALVAIEAIARDVTERKKLEERLEAGTRELKRSLAEKTVLLQEVHHRVNNNLQIICSLLSMQTERANGDGNSTALTDAHARVVAIALVHERVYRSERLDDLHFGSYIELLAARLFSARRVDRSRIRLEMNLEPIHLAVDQAVPCGLILNELLTNSLKHAFGDGREGVIRISLKTVGQGYAELAVADNGVGLPADFRMEQGRSLGVQLIRALIGQLGADLSVTADGGAAFRFGWRLAGASGESACLNG
jgi:PAS domain S-box-containing protein